VFGQPSTNEYLSSALLLPIEDDWLGQQTATSRWPDEADFVSQDSDAERPKQFSLEVLRGVTEIDQKARRGPL